MALFISITLQKQQLYSCHSVATGISNSRPTKFSNKLPGKATNHTRDRDSIHDYQNKNCNFHMELYMTCQQDVYFALVQSNALQIWVKFGEFEQLAQLFADLVDTRTFQDAYQAKVRQADQIYALLIKAMGNRISTVMHVNKTTLK